MRRIKTTHKSNTQQNGETAPDFELSSAIRQLKKEKNAILLAHYYQEPEIQDAADYVGDSLGLSQQAAETDADVIVFAGVHFMAETAKILNPGKKVLIPDLEAGCSLADSCPTEKFKKFIEDHPDHAVVSYVNCTAEIKAMSDVICTSSNAVQVISSIPINKPILFAPDKNLGNFLQKMTGRDLVIWDGICMVHQEFSADHLERLKEIHPGAKVIAHPECSTYMLDFADFIGSTAALLKFTRTDPSDTFIVATETGIFHEMKKASPNKKFIAAPVVTTCVACQQCPYMKVNTLEKVYLCLKNEQPEVIVPETTRVKALAPIQRMMELSRQTTA